MNDAVHAQLRKRSTVPAHCRTCDKPIPARPAGTPGRRSHYCSHDCNPNVRSKTRTCEICGAEYLRGRQAWGNNGCSADCAEKLKQTAQVRSRAKLLAGMTPAEQESWKEQQRAYFREWRNRPGRITRKEAARRAKIAAAKRGKPRPRHVIEAMRRGRLGKPHSPEAKAKMSAFQKARGTRPPAAGVPWTVEEDAICRTHPAAEVVRLTGRTLTAVYSRREILKVPDGRR